MVLVRDEKYRQTRGVAASSSGDVYLIEMQSEMSPKARTRYCCMQRGARRFKFS